MVDFIYPMPSLKPLSMLSSPSFVERNNGLNSILDIFHTNVWILIVVSFMAIILTNISKIYFKPNIVFDYLSVLFNKGKIGKFIDLIILYFFFSINNT